MTGRKNIKMLVMMKKLKMVNVATMNKGGKVKKFQKLEKLLLIGVG